MTIAQRWDALAQALTARVEATGDWDAPAPCEGWTARDVVGHLSWMPHLYLCAVGRSVPDLPLDPVGQWRCIDRTVRALLADDDLLAQDTTTMAGQMTLEALITMTGLMDVLVHTWDLARATGQDETLDAAECAGFLQGIEPMDEMLRHSGQSGHAFRCQSTQTRRRGCWPSPAAPPSATCSAAASPRRSCAPSG